MTKIEIAKSFLELAKYISNPKEKENEIRKWEKIISDLESKKGKGKLCLKE